MNYGEERAYWYLRLNGFFPIGNFVIHKSGEIKYSSDIDILALRPPLVFEEIGGKNDDWHKELLEFIKLDRFVGIVCEVKTGRYDPKDLFKKENVIYSIQRIGLTPPENAEKYGNELEDKPGLNIEDAYQICKLLIANKGENTDRYHFISMDSVIDFLRSRIRKYPKEKYRDRMFFSSILFQDIIDLTARDV